MKIITKAIMAQLHANRAKAEREEDTRPVLKLFGGAASTWLITEIDEKEEILFGLCDMGMGCREMGYSSLAELTALRFPPFGLPIERDRYFKAIGTLTEYADHARESQRIVESW